MLLLLKKFLLGELGLWMVVLRPIPSVSALGGGGRFASIVEEEEGRMEARQRKHSPVP